MKTNAMRILDTLGISYEKDYPVYVDEQIQLFDTVAMSAGVRGKQMILSPDDYLRATQATVGPISRTSH
jgi:Cys-tRNA(Pro)/Cys-tRNA(Cys) deacylase